VIRFALVTNRGIPGERPIDRDEHEVENRTTERRIIRPTNQRIYVIHCEALPLLSRLLV
jgi:hypothetical protein